MADTKVPPSTQWRDCLKHFPDRIRKRWGELSNELQDSGLPWNEAEWKAFVEVSNGMRGWERDKPFLPIPYIYQNVEIRNDNPTLEDLDEFSCLLPKSFDDCVIRDTEKPPNAPVPARRRRKKHSPDAGLLFE